MSRVRSLAGSFWVSAGAIALLLGFIGLFLPLLPTAPFVLLAAYCFSKGSPRWHAWLLAHKLFGPMLHDWQTNRVIRRRAKVLSTITSIGMITYPVAYLAIPLFAKITMVACTGTALVFVWMQKEG